MNPSEADLTPFAQGYVAELLGTLDAARMAHYQARRRRGLPEAVPIRPAFDWFAPEALALILSDCERHQSAHADALNGKDGPRRPDSSPQNDGRMFWHWRNKPESTCYAPLRVFLDGAGKIQLEPAQ